MLPAESIKGKRAYSILKHKCPVCHNGEVYKTNNPYDFKKFDKMYDSCSYCGHKYELETGFFYGAMYVSYGLSVAIAVAVFVGTFVLFPQAEYYHYIINIILGMILMMPITFRFSRLVWMSFFSSYGKRKKYNQ